MAPRADYADENMAALMGQEAKNSKMTPLDDFIWSYTEEPHASRRTQILKKYPEIKKLYGPEPLTKYVVAGIVALQFLAALYVRDKLFTWQFWVISYVIGATANHALFLAIHEITHNLAFKATWKNRYLAMFANLPIGIPYSVAFKGYHALHHRYQGTDGIDTDLPTKMEGMIFKGTFMKLLFCTFQILFYALRPMAVLRQRFTVFHLINVAVQLVFNAVFIYFAGFNAFFYFLMSDLLAGSLHPCAGHFISEHFVFVPPYETYSYYGPLNWLAFNVGYHNEHHDFPYIPWTRLPEVRKIAPEFYKDLPVTTSWPGTIYKYIFEDHMSAHNRVKRHQKENVHYTE